MFAVEKPHLEIEAENWNFAQTQQCIAMLKEDRANLMGGVSLFTAPGKKDSLKKRFTQTI